VSDSVLNNTIDSPDNAIELESAAAALREVEVEAAQSVARSGTLPLEQMSIDELRGLAASLDLPGREQLVEHDQLIAAIRDRRAT
jgi:hypothetical protein